MNKFKMGDFVFVDALDRQRFSGLKMILSVTPWQDAGDLVELVDVLHPDKWNVTCDASYCKSATVEEVERWQDVELQSVKNLYGQYLNAIRQEVIDA